MNPLSATLIFLVQTFFSLYILVLMLRLLLQLFGANFSHPIMQVIVKITHPILAPLQHIIPKWRDLDFANMVAMLILELVKLIILALIQIGKMPHMGGIVIWSVGLLFNQLINIFFFAILLRVLLSWAGPLVSNSPITHILFILTEPVMKRARHYIKPIGGLDLSPLVLLIALQVIKILLTSPLINVGISLALN